MTDFPRRSRPRRRKRFGEVADEVRAKTPRRSPKPEDIAIERERQTKAKALLEGGKRKHVDDVGASLNPEHQPDPVDPEDLP